MADRPAGGDQRLLDRIPAIATTTSLLDLAPHATPGGPDLQIGGDTAAIAKGRQLVILGDPVAASGTTWLPVYVLLSGNGNGWTDFFTWIPTRIGDQPTVAPARTAECPSTRDNLSTLAALDAFSRARCVGSTAFTIEGATGVPWESGSYHDVTPAWLGNRGGDPPFFSLYPKTMGEIGIRVPAGVEVPPPGITVRATVHVADREGADCRRTDSRLGLPAEAASDSQLWCAVQVVIERWVPLLGLEGRPFDAMAPQLRRTDASSGCAGVGSGLLTFRIDPNRLDPVWLEAAGGQGPILAWFTPGFRFTWDPLPSVVDAAGQAVAQDGTVVNPDGRLAGHFLCMTTSGLFVN